MLKKVDSFVKVDMGAQGSTLSVLETNKQKSVIFLILRKLKEKKYIPPFSSTGACPETFMSWMEEARA